MELIFAIFVTGLGLFGGMFFIWKASTNNFLNEDRPFKTKFRGHDGEKSSFYWFITQIQLLSALKAR
jgi:hypothetical protein